MAASSRTSSKDRRPAPARGRDFFLCHAGKDKPRIESYARRLKQLDATTAFDKYDFKPGQDWVVRIFELLENSRICVVFVSKHSAKAIVQASEAFHARYLAWKFPGRRQVIPVYLKGAPSQTDIAGLQTTSAYREDEQSLEEIAQGLVAQLRSMGDAADHATRAIDMIDEVALKWLFPPGHAYRSRYELRGNQMILRQRDPQGIYRQVRTISRDQFEAKLSAEELDLITHIEKKMELLFREWKKNDLDAVTSRAAEKRADEFARRLGTEVVQLLDLLTKAGFFLVDHYRDIRTVVANYYRAQGVDIPPESP